MRLSLLSKIVIGVALVLVWVPSLLVLLFVRVMGFDAATLDMPTLLNITLTVLVLTDSFRFYTWLGIMLFALAHTAASAWHTKRLNVLQVVLVGLSAWFTVALVTLPAYYVLFVLSDPPPAWATRLAIPLGGPPDDAE
jgi:hypothetical protein